MVEFALTVPIVLGLGALATEATNYALVHMRMSQIALNLADNISRVGASSPLALTTLRDSDVGDAFSALRRQGAQYDLTGRGRVVLSSLVKDPSSGKQYIQWQRCIGQQRYDSDYGVQGDGLQQRKNLPDTSPYPSQPGGMGPPGKKIAAPDNYPVMFVELTYDYRPVFKTGLLATPQLHYTAAFIVRDRRSIDNGGISSDTTPMVCTQYTS